MIVSIEKVVLKLLVGDIVVIDRSYELAVKPASYRVGAQVGLKCVIG